MFQKVQPPNRRIKFPLDQWMVVRIDLEERIMPNKIVCLGLGAVIALAALPALAQTNQSAAPAPSSASLTLAEASSGSYKSQMRHRSNMSKERARASAEHMRHLRHGSQSTH